MCKNKRKIQKLKLGEIGKRNYDFDFGQEKKIYSYLSCYKMNKKSEASIANFRFDSYKAWKDYVAKKYSNYDIDKLEEFNRYLNLRIRNTKYSKTYWGIISPVLLAVLIDPVLEMFLSIFTNSHIDAGVATGILELGYIVFISTLANLISTVILIAAIIFIIYYFIEPLSVNNVDYYFLSDYKEIIEDLIEKRKGK